MRYRLLGPLEVVRGGEVVDLGPPKQRAVLAVLLLGRGRVVSTDRLIDAVWETDAPPSATASLQAYISNLRRALRDNVNSAAATSPIVRQPPGYLLDVPAETVDIAEFLELVERARTEPDWTTALDLADQALGLWRGPVLADLRDEPWVQLESAGLDELRVEAREIRITALLAAGRVSPALVEAQQLHAEQPLRERTAWLYLLCLHRAGRTPDALAEYRRHTELLDEELGLEPGAELRDLQGAILRQDPELAAWPRSPQWTGARPQPEPERAPAEPVETAPTKTLVGRARETEILDRVLADVGRGATRWVVLTGPAGIGKTRLAEASAARLRADGAQEVWARCPDEDGAPAWWPIRQLVRGLGADPDVVLVPPPGADSDAARFAVYERVLDLLETSHDKKVLVVDDVQWADPTSVRCLAYLAGALRDRPVAVIVTLREGENEAAVQPLLTALARVEGHRQLTVPPLRNTEVSELADQISGERIDASEARLLAERTGGNPLFVTEYARLPREERDGIPLAVRSVLGRRLAGLDPAVLQVLRAAAVIGDVLEVDVLAAATGLDLDTLADQLDEAADEHLVVSAPGTGGYAFAHGLLREEVLAQMPALRRQRMHARVAAVLAGGPATPDRLSKRAGHLLSALPLADPAEVLEACVRAARDAAERWSSESAAQWWEAAITAYDLLPEAGKQGTERDDLLVARVEALARAGRGQTMLDVVEQGLLEAARDQRTESAGRLAATLIRSAGAWPWPGNGERPGPLLARLGQLESFAAPDPAAHARVLAAFAVGSCYDPDPAVPDRLSTRAMEIAEATGDNEVIADALLGRVSTYIGVAGHSEEAVELLGRLVKLGHRLARLDEVVADAMLTMPLMQLGDVAGAEERMRRAIAGSDLLRLPVIRVQMRWMSGTLALWRGDLDLAEQDFRSADQIHGRTELHSAGSTDMALNCLLLQQGRLAEADGQAGEPLAWGAAVAAARGEPEAAAHLVERFLAAPPLNVWTTLGHQALVAHTVADLGLTQHAPALLATLVAAEDRIAIIGQVGVVGPVAAAMARLHDLTGDAGEAQRLRDKAADLLRRTGGRLPPRTWRRLGESTPRSRQAPPGTVLPMTTTTNAPSIQSSILSLKNELTGALALPGEPGFELSVPWNVAVPLAPQAVILAETAEDVAATVRFAAAHGLKVAVQRTGHGAVELDGEYLLVHTGRLDEVTIDVYARMARVGAGVVWQTVIDAAAPMGLAPLAGSSPGVGVVGFLTGGGIGPFVRTYGLTSDWVKAFDVVTGDGQIRRATPTEHAELFWGLRGGKGTLGIVTAVEFEMPSLSAFYGGALYFDGSDAATLLQTWREWAPTLPETAKTSIALLQLPPLPMVPPPLAGKLTVALRFTTIGDDGEQLLAPIRALGITPLIDAVSDLPYAAMGAVHADPVDPMPTAENHALLGELTAEAIDTLLALTGPGVMSPEVIVELRLLGGALARQPEHASAFGQRDAAYSLLTIGVLAPEIAEIVPGHQAAVIASMEPWSTGGMLPNFAPSADPARMAKSYDEDTAAWLRALGDRYDPAGVLKVGQVVR